MLYQLAVKYRMVIVNIALLVLFVTIAMFAGIPATESRIWASRKAVR